MHSVTICRFYNETPSFELWGWEPGICVNIPDDYEYVRQYFYKVKNLLWNIQNA